MIFSAIKVNHAELYVKNDLLFFHQIFNFLIKFFILKDVGGENYKKFMNLSAINVNHGELYVK